MNRNIIATILLVDDVIEDYTLVSKTLENDGYAVTICKTIQDAREALTVESFNFILLNMLLSNGESCINFLKEIKSNKALADIPVIMLSATADKDNVTKCIDNGAKDFVTKPLDMTILRRRIERYLGESNKIKQEKRLDASKTSNILIVDDNELNRDLLEKRLLKFGYGIKTAKNGNEAIELAHRYPIHLILLDIMMPEKDGVSTLQDLKKDERLKRIPIIMLTALSDKEKVRECIDLGADDYVLKPFESKVLKARIEACLFANTKYV